MRPVSLTLLTLALLWSAIGCSPPEARLQGTWKVAPAPEPKKSEFGDDLRNGMVRALTAGSTIEFNGKGQYKQTFGMMEMRGTYAVKGDTVELRAEKDKATPDWRFRLSDGDKRLEQIKDFGSDPQLVFVKEN